MFCFRGIKTTKIVLFLANRLFKKKKLLWFFQSFSIIFYTWVHWIVGIFVYVCLLFTLWEESWSSAPCCFSDKLCQFVTLCCDTCHFWYTWDTWNSREMMAGKFCNEYYSKVVIKSDPYSTIAFLMKCWFVLTNF